MFAYNNNLKCDRILQHLHQLMSHFISIYLLSFDILSHIVLQQLQVLPLSLARMISRIKILKTIQSKARHEKISRICSC